MKNGFETQELTKFQNDLINLATKKMPKESKKFLNSEGNKLKKETVKMAKMKVKKKEGKYLQAIEKGKVYKYNGEMCIRVYSNAPHAHLIEYGHKQVLNPYKYTGATNIGGRFSRAVKEGKGIGKEIGFVSGKKVFETAKENFQNEYYKNTQEFIDKLLEEGLS